MFQTPERKSSFDCSADHKEKRNTSITVSITEPSSYATKSLQRPYTPSNPIPCPNADLYIEEKKEEECLAEMYDRSTWNMYNR